jgi:hypothetical protein
MTSHQDQHCLGSTITSMSQGLALLPRLVIRLRGPSPIRLGGLQEYFFDRQPNSGMLLLTASTLTRGKCVITTMIWDTSSNQLSHFLVVFYSELISQFTFNWLIYYSSIITSRGLHISCYTTPVLTACQFFNFYLMLMCGINYIE